MMVGDRLRMTAYLDAIRDVVRPGDVVVDIGSGTGVFALAACRAGARRVYAIESGNIVHVAREIVAANGCGSSIEMLEGLSTDVTLAKPADVVVLDVRGVLPDDQIPTAVDARRRFLREGGRMIPASDTLWAAPLSAPAVYDRYVSVWDHDEDGLDLGPIRRHATSRWFKCQVTRDQLAADPVCLGTIDYHRMTDTGFQAHAAWTIPEPRVAHGVVVWFDSQVSEHVWLSNRPGAPALLYGQGFFPWPSPRLLDAGHVVQFELTGGVDGCSYGWHWRSDDAT